LRGGDSTSLNLWDIIAVSLFGLSQLAAIPVYCELSRETLVTHLQVPPTMAFVFSHIMPWGVCAVTYNSTMFEQFIEWSSLLLLGFSNFSLPLFLDQKNTIDDMMLHHRIPGTGPDSVLWTFRFVTASIVAVIMQRMSDSLVLAESSFLITIIYLFQYY
jgi:hypothetical protein